MLTIGVSCSVHASPKALLLQELLKNDGFYVYLLLGQSESDLKRFLRNTAFVVSLIDEEWWQSSRGRFEIEEIHESHLESGRPIKSFPIMLQPSPLESSWSLVPYKSHQCPIWPVRGGVEADRDAEPRLREYLERISSPKIEAFNCPDTFHLVAQRKIHQVLRELTSEDEARSQLVLRRFNSIESSGILRIRTKDLLTTCPYIRTSISTWNMNLELLEYNREFLDAINAESEEEYIRCSSCPEHLGLNQDMLNTFRMRAGQLFEMSIVQETRLILLFPCKPHGQPKRANFVLKAIRDDANQLKGFICFSSVFERQVDEPGVQQISRMLREDINHEDFRSDLRSASRAPIPIGGPGRPEAGASDATQNKLKKKNLYLQTPDDYLNPDGGGTKKPLGIIRTVRLVFKNYQGPQHRRRKAAADIYLSWPLLIAWSVAAVGFLQCCAMLCHALLQLSRRASLFSCSGGALLFLLDLDGPLDLFGSEGLLDGLCLGSAGELVDILQSRVADVGVLSLVLGHNLSRVGVLTWLLVFPFGWVHGL
eukprot:TRINITY_DN9221_c0_g1_i1.p1 TRINITY_DN9221_c0_g1~~TRINITY_DN9221_c0_g1_i1.p1  ORF type:complete len:538 (+),score=48.31 TRINITY_DN9221_c0_g1_i1:336-1949(+)